jgi:NADP-reducing hydrogenase subunit HndD
MCAALHRLGFYRVFDTNFGADLTIMEEASELVERIKNGGVLPMITSCSPGWINFIELNYPELVGHLSTCKSPHQMMGAIIKSYYAKNHNIDPKDIFTVSVMPCTAKKTENKRPQMEADGNRDVDAVLTTRELAKMIRRAGINWNRLPDEGFDDDLLGEYTGAGVIFGVTGGVMEAAVRTAYNMLTGKELEPVEYTPVRGFEGIKEATVEINGLKINLCVASTTKNAKIIMDQIKAGTSKYNFIEIMACPGGCINGGGQPFVKPIFLPNEDLDIMETYRAKRASVLYKEDEGKEVRRSHLNKDIQKLYADFLGKPGSHESHKYLHTTYNTDREKFPCK